LVARDSIKQRLVLSIVSPILLAQGLYALDDGLARTPPMGWSSWNKIGCNVSEDAIKKAVDAMVRTGMKDVGYQYIVIDDCWQISRDEQGNILADRMPGGRPAPGGPAAVATSFRMPGSTRPGVWIT
jgi:alpha-galactosidase